MNFLQRKIQEASQKYYTTGTSDVSDAEFDKMIDQLRQEDPDSPLLGVGHGYDINADDSGSKFAHKYGVAGSLGKCHNWKEYPNALKGKDVIASLKLDGLSVVLYFEDGELTQALSRGDGTIGIDITTKVKRILSKYAYQMPEHFTGAIRGEILMTKDNFDNYSSYHLDAKNPRNTAAGLINSKQSTELNYLDIVIYTVVGAHEFYPWMNSYVDTFEMLSKIGIPVAPHKDFSSHELNESRFTLIMDELLDEWKDLGYPYDGIVLADSNVDWAASTKEVKYQASAFKFKAESAITKVLGIEWNLSKTGYLIPRIQLDTVQLSGTSVSWCTGFNAKNILDHNIGVGAEVKVTKANEIIPFLEEVITPADANMPVSCPCCESDLVWAGVHLCCTNSACSNNAIQDLLIWSAHIAPWDGLGDTLKLAGFEEDFGESASIESVYSHPEYQGRTSVAVKQNEYYRMYDALFTNSVHLEDALQGLNIPRLGSITSRRVAQYPEFVKMLMHGQHVPQLTAIEYRSKIGDANYSSIMKHAAKFKRLSLIEPNIIWDATSDTTEAQGDVAITGKLSVKRSDFEAELRAKGFNPVSAVKAGTEFLITDNPESSSSKNAAADKHGVPKITEAEFRSKYLC